ncbi:hypothetical protein AU468_03070 [Alkalispirochaeta sphaeroplastigenens]|uniref:Calcineurin-like phosphoesterase domain-containing protein n=1 Tax=Alkalispirochaeta sphaeroplastigenens TaxID=1187066 RepID=A0A2S4JYQ2_9SPIO|nr:MULTISPECIES: metallophosphoesterase [Alkalispirochaeta]POR04648.1 hypothetical protein AU468_03070 [Alkalispirochaeta sphaeroplastigenens]
MGKKSSVQDEQGQGYQKDLQDIYDHSPLRKISDGDRLVIFSDLHMGNGGRNDDFRHNGELFASVLGKYYARQGYHLVLNGDVEDLQRFSMRSIVHRWEEVYLAFGAIADRGGLTRIVGNHDLELLEGGPSVTGLGVFGREHWPETFMEPVFQGLRLAHRCGTIFIFHGHQTNRWYQKHNNIARLLLRYLANPLHVSTPPVADDSRRRFLVERRAYRFATERNILVFIGHTHRPLFESMGKTDSVLFEIEALCRAYPESDNQRAIEDRIAQLKEDLLAIQEVETRDHSHVSLYEERLLVPCMFNSGNVLGKQGMTCLEIEGGDLRLVYWADTTKKQRYQRYREYSPEPLEGTPFQRVPIKQDSLAYIFSRVHLLS